MSGHNKWSKVKRLKGALDAKRGNLFSRFSREITVAAKMGGGDMDTNFRLRGAVQMARAQNMPNDTIDRAIKKGTGELESQAYDELVYEGYAPGGVAMLIEAMTDNRNRTAADLRSIFSKFHGNLATSGSVAYLFHKKGQITVPLSAIGEEALLELVLDAGAEEFSTESDGYLITTAPDRLYAVGEAFRKAGVAVESMKLTYLPETSVPVTAEATASQVLHLCDALEECDDVQSVHSNFDISDALLTRLSE
ncbi:MAG: YebC/PmpR family DNA-binding transcriptional regulator [Chthoniobacteraceae bacterium]|nr:YebC/PmpR family DNA-binding transcriptional regulator [Chthoniobacteraceae bacterium]